MPAPDAAPRPPSQEPEPLGPVSLNVAEGPLVAPALSRVMSMVLARAGCPLDRLDDTMILCDAISAHAPAHTRDGRVAFTLTTRERAIELRVAELRAGGACALVEDAMLPDIGNVIERFSDAHRVEPAPDGTGEQLVLTVGLA